MSIESSRPEDLWMDMGAMVGAVLARWVRILFVTAIALAVTFAILLFMPRMYDSTAGLLVEQRANNLTLGPNAQPAQPSIPVEAMMSSQIELIKSRDTLMQVIESEDLRSEPEFSGQSVSVVGMVLQLLGRSPEPSSIDERILGNLRDQMTVARERDSAVISITVSSRDPELAARIANAVARAHVTRRAALSLSDTESASKWLEDEIAQLRVRVQEAEAAVAEYRSENDLFAGTNNDSILSQRLSGTAAQITAAQERYNAAQSRADLIRDLLRSGQAIDNIADIRNSAVIQQLLQTKATLQGELAQSASTLLPNHPTIKALMAQIDEIEAQIAIEGRRVADALEAEARIEANLAASLEAEMARLKVSVSEAARDTVELEGLQRDAKAQRDLLESYLLRHSDAVARTDASSALPDVRVITMAAPAVDPSSPKTTLVLGAVGFLMLVGQVGVILFAELMSGRALVQRPVAFLHPADDAELVERDDGPFDEAFDPSASDPAVEPAEDEPPPEEISRDAVLPEDSAALFADDHAVADAGWTDSPEVPHDDEPDIAQSDGGFDPGAMGADAEGPADEISANIDEDAVEPEPLPRAPMPDLGATGEEGGVAGSIAAMMDPADEPVTAAPSAYRAGALALQGDDLDEELTNLSADIGIGRVRVVLLSALSRKEHCEHVADRLVADALRRGLSVAFIDAGSGRRSAAPGLTDLSVDEASFGDVVHKVREGLAEVPWGREAALQHRSGKPATLTEALTDIYDVVLVSTGRMGMASSLPIFADIEARLVLVAGEEAAPAGALEAALEDAARLGFEVAQVVMTPPLPATELA